MVSRVLVANGAGAFRWVLHVSGPGGSAALAVVLTAAQLLPVIEFTQLTSRAAAGGPHEIYPFSLEPYRLLEIAWPNILGTQFEGNNYWGDSAPICPEYTPRRGCRRFTWGD